MKKKIFFFLSFLFLALLLPGIDRDKTKLDPNLFSPDYSQSKIVKNKRFGRALLFTTGYYLFNSVKYWIKYSDWAEDWDYELNWEDQRVRFFTLKAHTFDSNPFNTNLSHVFGSEMRYHFARYNRLNRTESFLLCVFFSLCWEYISEWREVISVNDNIYSTIGTIPFGEPLFQISSYFYGKGGTFNKILGTIFSPGTAINYLLDRKKERRRDVNQGFSNPLIDVYFGYKQVSTGAEKNRSPVLFHIGSETVFYTIPGYGAPGTINRFFKNTLLNEVRADVSFGLNSLEEYSLSTKTVLFGRYIQDIKQGSAETVKGYSLLFGGGSAFDLFKKRAIAYYDIGSYHYDFNSGERPSQPTEFTDKLAIINIIGPNVEFSLYANRFKLRLSVDAYADFAYVNSLALNEYSGAHDLFAPRLKTLLIHYGYYCAFGFTLSSRVNLFFRNFEINGKFKYQYYDSIEGLDRVQKNVEDDCNITDSRLMYRISLGYTIPKTPIKIVFAWEDINRRGSLKDITHRESEIRYFTQLEFSYLF
ncbi:MAG: DUF3943 domain-containing protein [Candidatus Aminicenantes bacterium]|nr:DUF3943 domain-containing protein [Candidatus Aminicenantes bacterium]